MTETSIVVVVAAVTAAPILADSLKRWIAVPNVVVELLLGVLLGPVALDWVRDTPAVAAISDLGLAMLMFLAGYEINFRDIRGTPLRLALTGWGISLVAGLAVGALIRGPSLGGLVLGLALTTTALGSILPILGDAGLLATKFGGHIMAIGAIGEFGPIVAVALLLTSDQPLRTSLLLVAFALIAIAAGMLAVRRSRFPLLARLVNATLNSSGQLAIRLSMLTIVLMLWTTSSLGLDVLLGAFAAGVVEHLAVQNASKEDREVVKSKLEAIGFGFLVPFFFVVSGVKLDITALIHEPTALGLIPLFMLLFLLVRGGSVPFLYRRVAAGNEVAALTLLSGTALPLVVVITTIGTQTGVIKTSTAAALVCAGMLSVLTFPLTALNALRVTLRPSHRQADLPRACRAPAPITSARHSRSDGSALPFRLRMVRFSGSESISIPSSTILLPVPGLQRKRTLEPVFALRMQSRPPGRVLAVPGEPDLQDDG